MWWHSGTDTSGIMHALVAVFLHILDFPQTALTYSIRDYIHANLERPISLENLADHAHLSRTA